MSITAHRLLERQSRTADLTDYGVSPAYMVVLNHIWNARYAAASEAISLTLSEDPDHPCVTKLYRAWIESLVQLGDANSLAELGKHLLARGREEEELRQTYTALRGIIHLELDQVPAMRLTLRATKNRVNNHYCLEFEQMCVRRGLSEEVMPILSSQSNIDDYFVWQTLIQDLALDDSAEGSEDVLRHVSRCFPGSPIADLTAMHRSFENHYWPGALTHAKNLHENFPSHPDYGFFHGLAAYQSGETSSAIKILEALDDKRRRSDVDVVHLLGESYAARGMREENDQDCKRGLHHLELAARLMRRHGMGVETIVEKIRELEGAIGGSITANHAGESFRAPRSWLVMLSPRRYEEMTSSGDELIQTLHRPLGREVKSGDVVLFMARSAHVAKKPAATKHECRIVAVYRVTSGVVWHPVHRWHSTMQLMDRPDHPIPIDVHDVKSDMNLRGAKTRLPVGHHARYGVYAMDDDALDVVVAAVKRRSEGIDHSRERRGEELSAKKPV